MIYFETERLLMRDFDREDLPEFRRMNEDPEVMRFFPKIRTYEETDAFYEAILKEFETYGFGLFAVERKDTGEFIGFIGFHRATFEADFTPCIEIGWRLKKEAWGYGFATEGARGCLKYAEDHYNFENIYSFTAKINSPSESVMQKIGLQKVGNFAHPNMEETHPLSEHVLYALKNEVGE
ncbi:GNAT family N-acetyltransferase [Heyndrickxia vini]|uniref:GNAT family N-acetyltransferase n=1 Tax=Heyndrickxia vini TaxID=1476025 RepID=A0ABX7E4L2_9BACI|nr:GNAT family N-acetyltransferase [Heyndrickxia vini]QQZ10228.1 GNAT family N-acetyltransferase [Heyndrickxia vini]